MLLHDSKPDASMEAVSDLVNGASRRLVRTGVRSSLPGTTL